MVDIDERTFQFSLKIIKLIDLMPQSASGRAISNQLIRSATSIGANV